jgi:hypothetical protein
MKNNKNTKADSRQMISDYMLNILKGEFSEIALQHKADFELAIHASATLLMQKLNLDSKDSKIESTIKAAIAKAAEPLFEEGFNLQSIKSALYQIGMPPELASEKDGIEFLAALRKGDFHNEDGSICYNVMSRREIELYELHIAYKGKSVAVKNHNQNLIHNCFPQKYEQSKLRKLNNLKKDDAKVIVAKEYATMQDMKIEDRMISLWRKDAEEGKATIGSKEKLKNQLAIYSEMPYEGKLKMLVAFGNLTDKKEIAEFFSKFDRKVAKNYSEVKKKKGEATSFVKISKPKIKLDDAIEAAKKRAQALSNEYDFC